MENVKELRNVYSNTNVINKSHRYEHTKYVRIIFVWYHCSNL